MKCQKQYHIKIVNKENIVKLLMMKIMMVLVIVRN